MIYIANPMYDAVFKFMMEDKEVAKRFIGIITGKQIVEIELLPQEKTYRKDDLNIIVQRLDFVAQIQEQDGNITKVLIEIQKSNKSYHADIMRFRGYLAKHYMMDNLPIITIYILGFKLPDLETAAAYIDKYYQNIYTDDKIQGKSEFVEKLTHSCYIIQVPRLKLVVRNKLAELLEIFNQNYRLSNQKEGSKILQLAEIPLDSDISLIIRRLEKAQADASLKEKLEDEEYLEMVYDEMYGEMTREIAVLSGKIAVLSGKIEAENQRAEEEKKRAELAENRLEQEKLSIIKNLLSSGMTAEQVMLIAQVNKDFLQKHGLI